MRKSGGREETSSEGYQDGPSSTPKLNSPIAPSSVLDDKDSKILFLARDRPTTLLNISERTDLSFVECLHRARRLKEMGLLKRAGDTRDDDGLFLYIAGRKTDPTPKSKSIP